MIGKETDDCAYDTDHDTAKYGDSQNSLPTCHVTPSFLEQTIAAPRGMNQLVIMRDDSVVNRLHPDYYSDNVVEIMVEASPFVQILPYLVNNQTKL